MRKKVSQKKTLTFILMILFMVIGYFYTNRDQESATALQNTITEGELQIYFLDVGQADSIFITQQGKNMLIDAGNNADGKEIIKFLQNNGIEKIDILIGTHPHEDHIGGLDDIITQMEIGKIYMPKQESTTKTFRDVLEAVEEKNMKITSPKVGDTFLLGDAICEIMAVEEGVEEANESSIVLEITFGTKKFLLTGDMEKINEEKRNWHDVDVLKVAHHGSRTSSSKEFLQQTMPEIAVISLGEGNDYGHPHDEVIERLENIGAEIYRTDLDGTILCTSDGSQIEIKKLDIHCDGDKEE